MVIGEYFCVICCRIIMAFYVAHSIRDFLLNDHITQKKFPQSVPITSSWVGKRLDKITQSTYYINSPICLYNDPFLH